MYNLNLKYFIQDTSLDYAKDCRDLGLLGEYELEALISAFRCEIDAEDFEESYSGEWPSDESFAKDLLEQTGDIPRDLPWYVEIDWKKTAEHIMVDYIDDSGHYFRIL